MQRFLILSFLIVTFIGCTQPMKPSEESKLSELSSYPACSTPSGNPSSSYAMDDTKSNCTSCDLISPCTNTGGGITYSWYSPKICFLCANNCPVYTAVGAFCTSSYGGACQLIYYGNSYQYQCPYGKFTANTYAAYGMTPSNEEYSYCGGNWTNNSNQTVSFPSCT